MLTHAHRSARPGVLPLYAQTPHEIGIDSHIDTAERVLIYGADTSERSPLVLLCYKRLMGHKIAGHAVF